MSLQFSSESSNSNWPVSNRQFTKVAKSKSWTNSPKVNGHLKLRANVLSLYYYENLSAFQSGKLSTSTDMDPMGRRYYPGWEQHPMAASAINAAYARFTGKLREGDGALGVTLGTYKESRKMIVNRSKRIGDQASALVRGHGRLGAAQSVAGAHLEVVFGWLPAISDMHAAATTVIQKAAERTFVTGRGNVSDHLSVNTGGGHYTEQISSTAKLSVKCTYNALVTISNPNLWLLNRAGLLNPATVAWDLVPFSFVFNWFVNFNSLINSVTDFVGLTFDNTSRTLTHQLDGSATRLITTPYGGDHYNRQHASFRNVQKLRTLTPPERPTLEFKLPEVDWQLAAIATSVLVQKLGPLARIYRATR